MSMQELIKKEKDMTTNGHDKGLGECHKRMEENSKAYGIERRNMIQEEID